MTSEPLPSTSLQHRHRIQRLQEYQERLLIEGPKAEAGRVRFHLHEAEEFCRGEFGKRFPGVMPYDIPNTLQCWEGRDELGVPYYRTAIKQALFALSQKLSADAPPTTPEGFRRLLPHLTRDGIRELPINCFGTTLSALFSAQNIENNCFADFILDVIHNDEDFALIRKIGIARYDFTVTDLEEWIHPDGTPTESTRELSLKFLLSLGARLTPPQDPRTPEGLKQVLAELPRDFMTKVEVNSWGTTVNAPFQAAYDSKISSLIIDLVDHHPDFAELRALGGVKRWDLKMNNWGTATNPSREAREAVSLFIMAVAEPLGVSPYTASGFQRILPKLTFQKVCETPLTALGSTAEAAFRRCYGTVSAGILDVISHSHEFQEVAMMGLEPGDFSSAPPNFWSKKGETGERVPTDHARLQLMRLLCRVGEQDHSLHEDSCVGEILKKTSFDNHLLDPNYSISPWGTLASAAIKAGYGRVKSRAERDLKERFPEIETLADLKNAAVLLEKELYPYKSSGKPFVFASHDSSLLSDEEFLPCLHFLRGSSSQDTFENLQQSFLQKLAGASPEAGRGLSARLVELVQSDGLFLHSEETSHRVAALLSLLSTEERAPVIQACLTSHKREYVAFGVDSCDELEALPNELVPLLKGLVHLLPAEDVALARQALYLLTTKGEEDGMQFLATLSPSNSRLAKYVGYLRRHFAPKKTADDGGSFENESHMKPDEHGGALPAPPGDAATHGLSILGERWRRALSYIRGESGSYSYQVREEYADEAAREELGRKLVTLIEEGGLNQLGEYSFSPFLDCVSILPDTHQTQVVTALLSSTSHQCVEQGFRLVKEMENLPGSFIPLLRALSEPSTITVESEKHACDALFVLKKRFPEVLKQYLTEAPPTESWLIRAYRNRLRGKR